MSHFIKKNSIVKILFRHIVSHSNIVSHSIISLKQIERKHSTHSQVLRKCVWNKKLCLLPILGMFHMRYYMSYMTTFYYYVLLCDYVQLRVLKYDINYFHLLIFPFADINRNLLTNKSWLLCCAMIKSMIK